MSQYKRRIKERKNGKILLPRSNEDPLEKENIKKTKRNKHKPTCSSLKRNPLSNNCGICGSENVVSQGIIYCEICGEEAEYWSEPGDTYDFRNFRSEEKIIKCNCIYEYEYRGRQIKIRKIFKLTVRKCTDCGAVQSNYCPNCKKLNIRKCWKHWDGRTLCQNCGYTIN